MQLAIFIVHTLHVTTGVKNGHSKVCVLSGNSIKLKDNINLSEGIIKNLKKAEKGHYPNQAHLEIGCREFLEIKFKG